MGRQPAEGVVRVHERGIEYSFTRSTLESAVKESVIKFGDRYPEIPAVSFCASVDLAIDVLRDSTIAQLQCIETIVLDACSRLNNGLSPTAPRMIAQKEVVFAVRDMVHREVGRRILN
ncbi:MAG: hypothetical protein AAB592_01895 [Patescibacteria group bacterium]